MHNEVRNHLRTNEILPEGSTFIVAVSGGVDSVVLLDILARLGTEFNWRMAVAHLNHNVRPDSAEDARLVGELAERYGLEYFMHQLTDPTTSEGALRKLRYDFLESVRQGAGAEFVVTAHHNDDRIETSVLNTIRGADRYGITALKPVRGTLVRPFLPFTKGQIIMHATTFDLPYREDSTNLDPQYRRNYVRHHLLPHATVIDPSFRERHYQALDHLTSLTERIDWRLSQLLEIIAVEVTDDQIVVQRDNFLKLSEQIQLNLLAFMARQLTGGLAITQTNLKRGAQFLRIAKTGAYSNAIPRLLIERVYDTFVVALTGKKDVSETRSTIPLRDNSTVEIGGFRIKLQTNPSPVSAENYLIKPSILFVRNWQSGDRIAPPGMTGRRKVSDIFTDKKVPRRARYQWPMIVDANNNIVCVAGLAVDRGALATPHDPHHQLIVEEYA